MMKTRHIGTLCSGKDAGGMLRRGVVLLAALLLVCTLMAGAVSAVEVSTWTDLKNNLSESSVNTINLTADIEADSQVNVTSGVTINGNFHTLSAKVGSWGTGNGNKHLLQINSTAPVTIKNLTLDSKNKAGDLHVYNTSNLSSDNQITLENLKINGSNMMGLHVNGANVSATNVTIENSGWGISVDIDSGGGVTNASNFAIDTLDTLCDPMKISWENFQKTPKVYVAGQENDPGYELYDGNHESNLFLTYGKQRSVWANESILDPNVLQAFNININTSVQNTTGPIALHAGLYFPLTRFAQDGANVTLLRDVKVAFTIPVNKSVTFDLNGHKLEAQDKTGSGTWKNLINVTNATAVFTLSDSKGIGLLDGYNGLGVINGTAIITSGVTINSTNVDVRLYGHASGSSDNKTSVDIQNGAKLTGGSGVGIYGNGYNDMSTPSIDAYGVDLTMNGEIVTDSRGVFTNGYIQNGDPKITIGSTARITSGIGLYGPSQVNWTINDGAVIIGKNESLSIKGGNWDILGGTFTSEGQYHLPPTKNTRQPEPSGATVSISTNDPAYPVSLVIHGGTFTSTHGYALLDYVYTDEATTPPIALTIQGGTFKSGADKVSLNLSNATRDGGNLSITGGKYSSSPAAYLSGDYTAVKDGDQWTVIEAAVKPKVNEEVTKENGETKITKTDLNTTYDQGTQILTLTAEGQKGDDGSVILNVTYSGTPDVQDKSIKGVVDTVEAFYQNISLAAHGKFPEIPKITLSIALKDVNTSLPEISKELEQEKIDALNSFGKKTYSDFEIGPAFVAMHENIQAFNKNITSITMTILVPKSWAPDRNGIGAAHISDDTTPKVSTNGVSVKVDDAGTSWKVTITSNLGFSGYTVYYGVTSTPPSPDSQPQPLSSGDGNMNNAFRVLFDTNGGSFISPVSYLSYGDKISQPPAPTKDGYTFGGWYKDSACTQAWSFSDSIPGDMTLYAKWTSTAVGQSASSPQTASGSPTAATPQTTQAAVSATATQSQSSGAAAAPAATTAAGASPTLTQAPAPIAGLLFGLLAAGILLRRRD